VTLELIDQAHQQDRDICTIHSDGSRAGSVAGRVPCSAGSAQPSSGNSSGLIGRQTPGIR
jgi:hypothetical protein